MKKIISRSKGITLVALVVTIVILLILSGVAINLALNNNGLMGKTQYAKNIYIASSEEEQTKLGVASDEIDTYSEGGTTISKKKGESIISSTDNVKLTDDNGKEIIIPAGFKIASDSATIIENGIVVEDANGNQYVWIPCTSDGANGTIKYDRYAFSRSGWVLNQTKTGDTITGSSYAGSFTETMPSDEQDSISKYNGFYIGRYEAGIATARTVASAGTKMAELGEVIEKKAPSYMFVTKSQAKSLAEEISTHYGYKLTSKLCSSYAWDTALKFIDRTVSGYSTDSTQGNYSGSLKNTGDSTAVCNIYDMGGNVCEWITETYSDSGSACVFRGGSYGYTSSVGPAGYRNHDTATYSVNGLSFRPTLYL